MITPDILKGAVDLHLHFGPDVIGRKLTALETARQAAQAGMRALMLKNHVTPTYGVASAVSEAVPQVKVFGGVALNAGVGGLNPAAVEAACVMGAKEVWMPTASAVCHLECFKGDVSKGVRVFDEGGKPMPGLVDILDMIAKADIILGSGHLAPAETKRLMALAKERGVKKRLVTHPEFICVSMPIDVQQDLAKQGVLFERCFYATNSPQKLPVVEIAEQIKAVGWESTVIASDFGQDHNPVPVEGLVAFLAALESCGLKAEHLRKTVTDHPAALLNL